MSETQELHLWAEQFKADHGEVFGAILLLMIVFLPWLVSRWVYPSIRFESVNYSKIKNVMFSTLVSFCLVRVTFAFYIVWMVASYPGLNDIEFWSTFSSSLITWDKAMLIMILLLPVFAFVGANGASKEEPWLSSKSDQEAGGVK